MINKRERCEPHALSFKSFVARCATNSKYQKSFETKLHPTAFALIPENLHCLGAEHILFFFFFPMCAWPSVKLVWGSLVLLAQLLSTWLAQGCVVFLCWSWWKMSHWTNTSVFLQFFFLLALHNKWVIRVLSKEKVALLLLL